MPGAGCRVPGAGCRVPGAGCRAVMMMKSKENVLDHENRKSLSIVYMLRELGAGCRVPGAGCRVPGGCDDEMKREMY